MDNFFNPGFCKDCKHVNQLFCALANDKEHVVTEENGSKIFKKGDIVFQEGNYPIGVHVVIKGKVKIVKNGEEGKEQIVRFARSGDLLGYRSLLGNHVYRATSIALSDVTICLVPEDIFHSALSKNNWLYMKLLKKLSNDLANAEDIILSISQKTVRERIAEAIIILYYKFGHDSNDSIDIKLTRKEIGNMAGTTIETTIRTLSELKKDGFIDFNGKQIIVCDIVKLVSLSHYNSIK